MELSALATKIATAERKTAEYYNTLLAIYPKNFRVLREYARFLEEIVRDDKAAREMWRKADKYEEQEMARTTSSLKSLGELQKMPSGDSQISIQCAVVYYFILTSVAISHQIDATSLFDDKTYARYKLHNMFYLFDTNVFPVVLPKVHKE